MQNGVPYNDKRVLHCTWHGCVRDAVQKNLPVNAGSEPPAKRVIRAFDYSVPATVAQAKQKLMHIDQELEAEGDRIDASVGITSTYVCRYSAM